jgi:hypothetical protein
MAAAGRVPNYLLRTRGREVYLWNQKVGVVLLAKSRTPRCCNDLGIARRIFPRTDVLIEDGDDVLVHQNSRDDVWANEVKGWSVFVGIFTGVTRFSWGFELDSEQSGRSRSTKFEGKWRGVWEARGDAVRSLRYAMKREIGRRMPMCGIRVAGWVWLINTRIGQIILWTDSPLKMQ